MSDWSKPVNTDTYADYTTAIKDRDLSAAKMDYASDSNIPTGVVRLNTTTDVLEKYNGTTWDLVLADVTNHADDTGNVHGLVLADLTGLGALDAADFTAHTGATNPHSLSADDLVGGGITDAEFTSHLNDTNPHSITPSDINALSIASNLSDLNNTTTARTNLGLGTLAEQSAISNADWSGTDLEVANGGTGASNATDARANIVAAQSGINFDITQLKNINLIEDNANVTIGPSTSNAVLIQSAGTSKWIFSGAAGNPLYPTGTSDLGTVGNPVNNIYFDGELDNLGTTQSWSFFSYTTRNSIDPTAATAQTNADAINTIAKKLENLGLFN